MNHLKLCQIYWVLATFFCCHCGSFTVKRERLSLVTPIMDSLIKAYPISDSVYQEVCFIDTTNLTFSHICDEAHSAEKLIHSPQFMEYVSQKLGKNICHIYVTGNCFPVAGRSELYCSCGYSIGISFRGIDNIFLDYSPQSGFPPHAFCIDRADSLVKHWYLVHTVGTF